MNDLFGRVAVIGAGTMGAGIAAQIANAGTEVLLLDLPAGEGDRRALPDAAIARMLSANPGPFMHPAAARRIDTGNTEDDLHRLEACDWVIEAVAERLDIKQALYRRIDGVRRPGTAISSNTSTIALARLTDGMPASFQRDFLITHFFNPPRQMRLVELVTGARTDLGLAARVRRFADAALGKSVVACHDTPGFIANRVGAIWMLLGLTAAFDLGIAVETADAVLGRPFGIPGTGVFGLMDLVGLDVMADIAASLAAALPRGDAFHVPVLSAAPLLQRLIAEGRTGRKGGAGFYRSDRTGGRGKEALDLARWDYRSVQTKALPEVGAAGRDIRALLDAPGPIGEYARRVMLPVLAYAAALVPEATDSIEAIDAAMQLGYNWQQGPFQMSDRLGLSWLVERLVRAGAPVPPLLRDGAPLYRVERGRRQARGLGGYRNVGRSQGVLLLADIRLAAEPLLRSAAGAVWDIGDGVACFEATTKMGTFDPEVFDLLQRTVTLVTKRFRALVLYHEGSHFSAGANLALVVQAAKTAAWAALDSLLLDGQRAFKALKYAPFPVVAAPFGLALGGGCEIVLSCDAVQAHAELSVGLVECNVGLIPGWGGCGEMLERLGDATAVFDLVSAARVSTSAADARASGYLRPTDGITMNRDRLLADAKARALAMVERYTPPDPPAFSRREQPDQAALRARLGESATAHDGTIAAALACVLTGDDAAGASEVTLLELERRKFLSLARTPQTLARIEHVLATGKPLRN